MCGRFALRLDVSFMAPILSETFILGQHAEIQQLNGYEASIDHWERRDDFVPRFNIAPHTQAPVIRRRDHSNPELIMSSMKWGLYLSKDAVSSKRTISPSMRASSYPFFLSEAISSR